MRRQSKRALALGWVALVAAAAVVNRPVLAQDRKPAEAGAPSKAAAPSSERAAAAPASGHDSAESPNPMKPEPSVAFWTVFVFAGLLFVLGKYAWKPLLNALHEREKHLEHVLTETERARNESEANLAEHRKLMTRASDEVRGILDKARQEAQAAANQIVKQAQGEAELAKERAGRDIAAARDQALAEIWHKTADMAVTVAGRVLAKELTGPEQHRLLDRAIQELPDAPGSNGHGGKAG
jgi:F-type H+-transporting ATPase subunit b